MGNFSPRNVSQLLVAKTAGTVNDAAAVGTFVVTPIVVTPAPAAGGTANKGVRIMVKTATGVKVSDFIPANADYKASTIAAGVKKKVTVTVASADGFTNKTFAIDIDKHDHIGSMLNDRFMSAYVVTDENDKFLDSTGVLVAATAASVAGELAKILAATLKLTGKEFTAVATGAAIAIEEIPAQYIAGVKDGINLPWEVIAGVKNNDACSLFFEEAFAQVVVAGKVDDLIQLKNVEWFNGGYDKDPYRETGYPALSLQMITLQLLQLQ